jgi:transcriptional regulator with XRE-family HTH domain
MDLIKQLRRKKGWSQEHLAQAADVARATIQRIELGQVVPSNETLQSLAAAFGVDPEHIRVATGRAALVGKVMEITLRRDATARELAPLAPELRQVFEEYYSARAEMNAFNDTLERTGARSTTAFAASHQARQELMEALLATCRNPTDTAAWEAYTAANARVEDLARSANEANSAVMTAMQGGPLVMRRWHDASLAVTQLLLQFV